jgi:hypothetical protein
MSVIKHSKYRNSGILFELLVRRTTADLLENKDSRAVKLLKKYFTNTELGREYYLYNSLINSQKINEAKADILINTVLEQYKKLNKSEIEKQKFNLIKEVKRHYNLDEFFKAKIDNYKVYASIYTIFESQGNKKSDVTQVFNNKISILEHITKEPIFDKSAPKAIIEELMKEDKEIRILAYKILVEKFNEKYQGMSARQKEVLKVYINSISDSTALAEYLNEQLTTLKAEIIDLTKKVDDAATKIKLAEVVKFIKPIKENKAVKDETITGILQFIELVEEVNKIK